MWVFPKYCAKIWQQKNGLCFAGCFQKFRSIQKCQSEWVSYIFKVIYFWEKGNKDINKWIKIKCNNTVKKKKGWVSHSNGNIWNYRGKPSSLLSCLRCSLLFFHFYIRGSKYSRTTLRLVTLHHCVPHLSRPFFFYPPSHHKLDLMLTVVLRQTE